MEIPISTHTQMQLDPAASSGSSAIVPSSLSSTKAAIVGRH